MWNKFCTACGSLLFTLLVSANASKQGPFDSGSFVVSSSLETLALLIYFRYSSTLLKDQVWVTDISKASAYDSI